MKNLLGVVIGIIVATLLLTLGWQISSVDALPGPEKANVCQDGAELIASMEEGKVNVYRVTSCIYYEGTDILARRHICYVTVGELHGKTVAMECYK